MYFAVSCYDKDDSLALRMATREAHLAFVAKNRSQFILVGPLLSDDEQMIGSHLIIEANDRTALDNLLASDPYSEAKLFAKTTVKAMKIAFSTEL
ncbi:MAG: YciI family protein [Rhizobiales bacterium]|nr:YciI family protein [Hyphomicrobiales bacterium]NRB15160.1 YciI family protein [Hyphomicrobiales bacterium]